MDKRILNTKRKLKENLLLLLKKKQLKEITVLELCKKANINRTTFYKYYLDIEDLLNKIEDTLLDNLKKEIDNIHRNYLLSYTTKIIEIIKDKKEIYIPLLGKNGDYTFLSKILKLVYKESIMEWQKLLKKATPEDLENIYNFIVDGTIGIINAWIENDCSIEQEKISIFINKICMSGLSSFI